MTPQEELAALRRMAELEDKAAGKPQAAKPPSDMERLITGKPKQSQPATLGFRSRPEGNVYGMGPVYAGLDFLDAGQHHVVSTAEGLGQLIHKGVTAAADLLPEGNAVRQWADDVDRRGPRVLAKREADYQARVPDSAASYAGAATGEALPWMTGMGELRAAGILPTIAAGGFKGAAQKGGLLALEGAAYGATRPVTEEGGYAGQKAAQIVTGAIANPVGVGVAKGAGMLARGAGRLSRYATASGRESIGNERLGQMFGSDAEVLAKLREQEILPGFDVSAAQAIGTPEAVQAERGLRNSGLTAPEFARRDALNHAAIRDQVARVAGTDADMQAAVEARSSGPGAFWRDNLPRGAEEGRYSRAQSHLAGYLQSKPLPVPEFKILDQARKIAGQVQRGSMDQAEGDAAIRALAPTTKGGKKALDQALGLIDGGMVNPSRIITDLQRLAKDTNPSISGAAERALAGIAKNQDGQGWVHGRVLDGLRQNFGKLVADSTPNGVVGSAEGAAFGPVKAKITNSLDRVLPGYRNNLAAYASASQPINDMEAGRALLGAIDGNSLDSLGGQNVSLTQLKAALRRNDGADFPMSPAAEAKIRAAMIALQKRSISNNTIAGAGPGTAADAQRAMEGAGILKRLAGHGAGVVGGATLGGGTWGPLLGYLAAAGTGEAAALANRAVVRQVGRKATSAAETANALEALRGIQTKRQPSILDLLLPYQHRALPPPR